MSLPSERPAIIDMHGFEKAIAVEKAAIEDRNDSLFLRNEAAVDEGDHNGTDEVDETGPSAVSTGDGQLTAWRKPRALARVSSYSASGMESATMPAPTWSQAVSSLQTAVRMAMLNWLSRLKPM